MGERGEKREGLERDSERIKREYRDETLPLT